MRISFRLIISENVSEQYLFRIPKYIEKNCSRPIKRGRERLNQLVQKQESSGQMETGGVGAAKVLLC